MKDRLRIGVAALGATFILAIVLGASGVLTPKDQRIALGASTTLSIISGDVQVRHGANAAFAAAEDGAILSPGDAVRTGPDARAVLTYFEGSTVEVEPSSEIAIDIAHGNPDGSTVIVMSQELGTTWHVVTHLVQGGSKYEVHTTASTASVRGTEFTVGVATDHTTTVTTTEGDVATSDPASTKVVDVTPGLTTTTTPGQTPADPKPAPDPDRKVTVTVGDQNTIIVDMFGRANGIKDGKKIVQTPGAQVAIVDGKLVVTLPGLPDGALATHFLDNGDKDVDVSTKVEEKGKAPVEVTDQVKPSTAAAHSVELKRSSGDTTVTPATGGDDKRPKIGEILPVPTTEDQEKAAESSGSPTTGAGAGERTKSEQPAATDGHTKTKPPVPTGAERTNTPHPTRSADPVRPSDTPGPTGGGGSGFVPPSIDIGLPHSDPPPPPPGKDKKQKP